MELVGKRALGIWREMIIGIAAPAIATFLPGVASAVVFKSLMSNSNDLRELWLYFPAIILIETASLIILIRAASRWTSSKIIRFVLVANAIVYVIMLIYNIAVFASSIFTSFTHT